MIGSLGLTHLLLPGFSVDEHAVASRRASSRSRHWWTQARPRTLSFHRYTGETRSCRADDIQHGRYYDHDEGGSPAIPTDGLRRRRHAADLLAHGDQTQTCRCRAPESWPSSYEAGQPSRWSAPTCPAGITRSTSVPLHPVLRTSPTDRRLHRLGHLTTGAADVQRPTSEPPRIDVQPNSPRDTWTAQRNMHLTQLGSARHTCCLLAAPAALKRSGVH